MKDGKRLMLMVDTENLWMSCHEVVGQDTVLDYKKLLEKVKDGRKFSKVEAKAFVPVLDVEKSQSFITTLRYLGYGVETSFITEKEGKLIGTDVDMLLAIDALRKIDSFDVFVLAAGDGDFAPLLEYLNEKGKVVECIAFENGFSEKLRPYCMNIQFLGKEDVYEKSEFNGEGKNNNERKNSSTEKVRTR